jgi:(1->4)-alpha-D-glucan 1-alpha-D-glucosylmutase
MRTDRVVPRATYRLQLRPGFGFDEVAAVGPYLAALGVSHVYLSPILQAAPGSTHGYDVVDHARVNDELGGAEAHARMCLELGRAGLGQVVDVVPNHMSVASHENRWWWDVLENGPASRYAGHFDVDWNTTEARLKNKVLLPILGERYGAMLEKGDVRPAREGSARDGASFVVKVHDKKIPLSLPSLVEPLGRAAARTSSDELAFLADALSALPDPKGIDAGTAQRRDRDKAVIARHLGRVFEAAPEVADAVDAELAAIHADPERLDALLEQQNYRLAFWRAARHDLDYRRFFDVNTLAGLRMGEERVFQDTHGLVLSWAQEGVVDGLRIDHPDGLRDPEGYLRRLRQASPRAWIVVEKILEHEESLPESWPCDGTTGYDFAVRATGLQVDPAGEGPLTEAWAGFVGGDVPREWERLVRRKKRLVLRELFSADVGRLVALLVELCERDRRFRDYTRQELREPIEELLACLPVYRTYARGGEPASERDVKVVDFAVAAAKEERPQLDDGLLQFFRALLCGHGTGDLEQKVCSRFQQLSGAVMAKGCEDTAFYCHHRLVALNEVGGDPSRVGEPPAALHAWLAGIQARWPGTMLALSTHDTKRSADVRARLALLSECAPEWLEAARRWSAAAEKHRAGKWPDKGMEYLLWQTLVGAWPLPLERLGPVPREGRARGQAPHLVDDSVDEEYEAAVQAFAKGVMGDADLLADVKRFVDTLVGPGRTAALATQALQLCAPGVPDLYQGTEVWDLSLTDPDNRRAVDYDARRALLADLESASVEDALARADEGAPKLWLISRVLGLRREHPEWFGAEAAYAPSTPPTTAASPSPARPAWPASSRAAACRSPARAGATRRWRSRTAPGRTCSPASGSRAGG